MMMGEMAIDGRNDDPRRLRELLGRAATLASDHALCSVVVGMAGPEGDLIFPEVVDYIESALRVDDAIFRLTRERALLVLADVDRTRAEEIVDRLLSGFRERYAQIRGPEIQLGWFEVTPRHKHLTVKEVLPTVFGVAPSPEN
jgi:hypothetical protein